MQFRHQADIPVPSDDDKELQGPGHPLAKPAQPAWATFQKVLMRIESPMNPALEQAMTALKKDAAFKSEIVRDPSVMSGEPVVRGTRIPAMTIVAYLRAGHSAREIFSDYPTLPLDGIEAVKLWAERALGADWQTSPASEEIRR